MLFFVLFFCYFRVVVVLFFAFEGSKELRTYNKLSAHLLLKFGFVSASFLLVGLYFAYSGTSEWLLLS